MVGHALLFETMGGPMAAEVPSGGGPEGLAFQRSESLGVGDVVDLDVLAAPYHALAQAREVRHIHVENLAAHQVNQVLPVRVAQVVGDLRGGEAHEVPRPDLELLAAYLRDAAPGEDVDPLLLPEMRVVDERFLARRHDGPGHAQPREPDQRAQARAVELRVGVPGVGVALLLLLDLRRPSDEPLLRHRTRLLPAAYGTEHTGTAATPAPVVARGHRGGVSNTRRGPSRVGYSGPPRFPSSPGAAGARIGRPGKSDQAHPRGTAEGSLLEGWVTWGRVG